MGKAEEFLTDCLLGSGCMDAINTFMGDEFDLFGLHFNAHGWTCNMCHRDSDRHVTLTWIDGRCELYIDWLTDKRIGSVAELRSFTLAHICTRLVVEEMGLSL